VETTTQERGPRDFEQATTHADDQTIGAGVGDGSVPRRRLRRAYRFTYTVSPSTRTSKVVTSAATGPLSSLPVRTSKHA